jgi:hypothetical protein
MIGQHVITATVIAVPMRMVAFLFIAAPIRKWVSVGE